MSNRLPYASPAGKELLKRALKHQEMPKEVEQSIWVRPYISTEILSSFIDPFVLFTEYKAISAEA